MKHVVVELVFDRARSVVDQAQVVHDIGATVHLTRTTNHCALRNHSRLGLRGSALGQVFSSKLCASRKLVYFTQSILQFKLGGDLGVLRSIRTTSFSVGDA